MVVERAESLDWPATTLKRVAVHVQQSGFRSLARGCFHQASDRKRFGREFGKLRLVAADISNSFGNTDIGFQLSHFGDRDVGRFGRGYPFG